jgi:hypothetical protein
VPRGPGAPAETARIYDGEKDREEEQDDDYDYDREEEEKQDDDQEQELRIPEALGAEHLETVDRAVRRGREARAEHPAHCASQKQARPLSGMRRGEYHKVILDGSEERVDDLADKLGGVVLGGGEYHARRSLIHPTAAV